MRRMTNETQSYNGWIRRYRAPGCDPKGWQKVVSALTYESCWKRLETFRDSKPWAQVDCVVLAEGERPEMALKGSGMK